MSISEFSHLIALSDLVGGVRECVLTADAKTRAALARRFGLVQLERLQAWLNLEAKAGRVDVRGRFEADVIQECSISGADVPARLCRDIQLLLVEKTQLAAMEADESWPDDLDTDLLPDEVLDVGEIIAQSLSLALDPYPRAAGAVLNAPDSVEVNAPPRTSPFAVLKKLKEQ